MSFSPELAEIRFGYGLSPVVGPPRSPEDLAGAVDGPDRMAQAFPIDGFDSILTRFRDLRAMRARAMKASDKPAAMEKFRDARNKNNARGLGWAMMAMLRCTHSPTAFRERITAFWADHFTAFGKVALLRPAAAPYIEDAIRPHVAGRFADLLVSAVTHPIMLLYLDQAQSVGPASRAARRNKRLEGLNENLAREVLELHTLGVGGPYGQDDVRQLAELFTGLSFDPDSGFVFRPQYAEPGRETVLGRSYGGDPARVEQVVQALRDLATHPATARHIARKLAVHFVSDTPDAGLVDHLAARFTATGGDLRAVYGALLEHPAAWAPERANIKPPVDFFASAWRALAVDPAHVAGFGQRQIGRLHIRPLKELGQPWLRPNGPDGWPEPDTAWITPQGIANRLRWAVTAPRQLKPDLPDPRDFVGQALGAQVSDEVRFAAAAAESQPVAIGLVLASPAFQRR